MKVLVVDDSLTVRMDLEEAFAEAGLRPTLCATAETARAALAREAFDLLVLDVRLPDADGVTFMSEVRRSSEIPIILLSSEAEVHDRLRGLRTGASEYVGKPYDRAYLVARAEELTRVRTETGKTVLVIDDSLTFRERLRATLERAGYDVAVASGGTEGLRLAAQLRPALVVVDGVMPDVDGVTVIRRLRLDTRLRTTPCILLTASDDRGAELHALDAGADAFARKDDDLDVILARVAAVLRHAVPADQGATASVLGPKKILAVDDSATFLDELSSALASEGYDVILARSGEAALEMLVVQRVDCVLLDVMMPGLDGHEVCARIKASPITRDVPVIMLTASEERSAMLDGMNAGADDYVAKSADFDVLRARLRAQIRRKQFEDENRRVREQVLTREIEATEARAAKELAEARAVLIADLEAFSYSVSHDLRAPLRAIDGYARILLEDHGTALGEEGTRVAGVIVKNAEKMARLIDDLLEFSRATRRETVFEEVDMAALAREVAADVTEKNRIIEMRIGALPPTWGDQSMLRQVWQNLLGNAVKYTRTRERAVIDVEGVETATEVVYTVRDNGVGFDSRYKEKLFAVFQRLHDAREFEGTGIGLALVKRILRRHDGWIDADSVLGEGATFRIGLPKKAGS
ncbi:MAG TPA: response regulator [Polyangiaceae bacterium]|jgi:DNA-binding response OmpR family regulator